MGMFDKAKEQAAKAAAAKIWNSVGWTLGIKNKGVEQCINQIVAARLRHG